jgi:hypothetical protein
MTLTMPCERGSVFTGGAQLPFQPACKPVRQLASTTTGNGRGRNLCSAAAVVADAHAQYAVTGGQADGDDTGATRVKPAAAARRRAGRVRCDGGWAMSMALGEASP